MTTAQTSRPAYQHPAYQHPAYQPVRLPDPDRDRFAWIAPTIATVLLLVLVPLALLFGGLLSVLAAAGCGSDCSKELETSVLVIWGTLCFGGFVTHAAVITSWALPWKRRYSALRAWMAVLSLLPPLLVLLLVFNLPKG
ncbi:hypothetical protein [Streptomyces thermoalcalitolerans]